jgi:uncharacterized protein (TIGR00156 family)
MKKLFLGIYCLLFSFSAALVYGEGFTGPGSNNRSNNRQTQAVMASQPITVKEARDLPKNSWVVLTGNIVNALPGGKYYTFRDSSGEITVEIDWKVWRGLSAGASENVQISGGVERERGQVKIEVKAITGSGSTNTVPGQAVTVSQPVTVRAATNLPSNSWVIVSGNIINALRDEKYTFRDSSGEIILEIERDVWRGLSIGVSDRVEISGELNIKKGQVSINVKVVRKIYFF